MYVFLHNLVQCSTEYNLLQISTCVGFAAIAKALTKFSHGLQYTSVGAVGCARGEMFIKNGVGNLQKGTACRNP
ncbi:hypothetical protein BT96DRAFT_843036 [Gymnopus androsaceus JB14]|uniref:Uncharacterized protein n=1 Tax=Gymnopus androsaceus JB14 TaxID=1447944 RepID=A0A6A4GEH5_9AGAR|nr:hypothetical protein BT96DRAFT_843036 [Gymnopus androsaceus JB14]